MILIIIFSLAAWTLYGIISRLILSPLVRIPGPTLAALTYWYEFYYDVICPGRFIWKIQALHEKYGPVVRITPKEVHVSDLGFLDTIYAPSAHRRDKEFTGNLAIAMAVAGTRSHELHKKRREALNPFFSKRSVLRLEPVIAGKVEKLCRRLDEAIEQKSVANLSDLYFALAYDVVAQYSFAIDENLLEDISAAATQRENLTRLMMGVKIRAHFPWISALGNMLPMSVGKRFVPPAVVDMIRFSKKIRIEIEHVLGGAREKPSGQRSIFFDLRDNPTLPESEKSVPRLEHEASFLVMAGTESTAKSLAITHYHILSNPSFLSHIRSELRNMTSAPSVTALEQLPYLSACIAEGNRLTFGLTKRNTRIAPDEDLRCQGCTIPAGTPMSTTSLCVHTDETVFPDPLAFVPERWLGPEGVERRKWQFAFGKGGRKCLGINLAHAELYLAIAAIVGYELELFETGGGDVEFRHDYQVAHPKLGSKGVRALVKGKM